MSPKILPAQAQNITAAAKHLRAGGLVGMPTETVYGLAADAENQAAVASMYLAKARPGDHPVIVHLASAGAATNWVSSIPEFAKSLMKDFWPGPMTLILPRSSRAKDFVTGSQDSVGLRVPGHPVALELLRKFEELGGHGLVAPSANRYGSVSPTTAQAVFDELGGVLAERDVILDGGAAEVGLESTIIDCTGAAPVILRPGAITSAQIEQSCGLKPHAPNETKVRVSGSHKKHYSPRATVHLSPDATLGSGFIALAEIPTPAGAIRLAQPNNLEEYANQLFAALRAADNLGLSKIFAVAPQGDGLAIAIRDRLSRAAHQGSEIG